MRIGVLGGGQLGLMLAEAGRAVGHSFTFLDPSPEACARRAGRLIAGGFNDSGALDRLVREADLATYEFENVSIDAVQRVGASIPILPGPESLRIAQDRALEKRLFTETGFGVVRHALADSLPDLATAIAEIGAPGVLKARRGGYDGRSQAVIQGPGEAGAAWEAIGGAPAIYEGFVSFRRELSLVGVRSRTGETAFYPLVENHHEGGILRTTVAPAPGVTPGLEREARDHVAALMERLGHVGVLTVEFFEVDGRLMANEFAPRVHNSGHWTIEGARASQFHAHVAAITGGALPDTRPASPCVMVNLIGAAPDEDAMRAIPHVHVHLYGKRPRPGRKIGHCTIAHAPPEEMRAARARLEALLAHWTDDPDP